MGRRAIASNNDPADMIPSAPPSQDQGSGTKWGNGSLRRPQTNHTLLNKRASLPPSTHPIAAHQSRDSPCCRRPPWFIPLLASSPTTAAHPQTQRNGLSASLAELETPFSPASSCGPDPWTRASHSRMTNPLRTPNNPGADWARSDLAVGWDCRD